MDRQSESLGEGSLNRGHDVLIGGSSSFDIVLCGSGPIRSSRHLEIVNVISERNELSERYPSGLELGWVVRVFGPAYTDRVGHWWYGARVCTRSSSQQQ